MWKLVLLLSKKCASMPTFVIFAVWCGCVKDSRNGHKRQDSHTVQMVHVKSHNDFVTMLQWWRKEFCCWTGTLCGRWELTATMMRVDRFCYQSCENKHKKWRRKTTRSPGPFSLPCSSSLSSSAVVAGTMSCRLRRSSRSDTTICCVSISVCFCQWASCVGATYGKKRNSYSLCIHTQKEILHKQ